eukprot:1406597-Pleurochrysis_carterae.AAC.1
MHASLSVIRLRSAATRGTLSCPALEAAAILRLCAARGSGNGGVVLVFEGTLLVLVELPVLRSAPFFESTRHRHMGLDGLGCFSFSCCGCCCSGGLRGESGVAAALGSGAPAALQLRPGRRLRRH